MDAKQCWKKERVINESLILRNMINVSTQQQLKLLPPYYLLWKVAVSDRCENN